MPSSMNNSENTLIYWSLGSAVIAYALLALHLVRQGFMQMPAHRIDVVMLFAALCTVLWSAFSWMALTMNPAWGLAAYSADILRYLCWGVFIALFFKAGPLRHLLVRWRWVVGVAGLVGAPLLTILVQMWAGPAGKTFLMVLLSLGMLVLVEQLFRNLPEDSVWGA